MNCVYAKAHKENYYPIPGGEGVGRTRKVLYGGAIEAENWRGIRREGVEVGEKISLCKKNHVL